MAAESLPKSWKCEVRVEEFTHFILLVYLPHNLPSVEANDIASYLNPIIKHCSQWLTDISIFDSKHKSYLFFDNITIRHLEKMEHLTDELLEKVKQQGDSFTRFNSKTIQCEKHNGHLFLPIEITGPNGVLSCMALLDTGASITTISQGIIAQTGSDHLTNAPRQTFQTANGWMSCPVVHRTVDIGGFRQDISIAVNQRDEINLLGMNYFQGLRYIVDSSNSCIYVWAK